MATRITDPIKDIAKINQEFAKIAQLQNQVAGLTPSAFTVSGSGGGNTSTIGATEGTHSQRIGSTYYPWRLALGMLFWETDTRSLWVNQNSTGTVNTVGTAVTWATGNLFDVNWAAGGSTQILINGVSYAIVAVASTTSLTIATSAGTHSGLSFSVAGGRWVGAYAETGSFTAGSSNIIDGGSGQYFPLSVSSSATLSGTSLTPGRVYGVRATNASGGLVFNFPTFGGSSQQIPAANGAITSQTFMANASGTLEPVGPLFTLNGANTTLTAGVFSTGTPAASPTSWQAGSGALPGTCNAGSIYSSYSGVAPLGSFNVCDTGGNSWLTPAYIDQVASFSQLTVTTSVVVSAGGATFQIGASGSSIKLMRDWGSKSTDTLGTIAANSCASGTFTVGSAATSTDACIATPSGSQFGTVLSAPTCAFLGSTNAAIAICNISTSSVTLSGTAVRLFGIGY